MPLDDTTGLLDQKDKVKPEVFSVEGLRDWLRTMPRRKRYCYANAGYCLIARFMLAHGAKLPNVGGFSYGDDSANSPFPKNALLPDGMSDIAVNEPYTFGAALARCEAYLSTTSGDGGE